MVTKVTLEDTHYALVQLMNKTPRYLTDTTLAFYLGKEIVFSLDSKLQRFGVLFVGPLGRVGGLLRK